MGHPTACKDRVQGTEDTLTPDLMNHLVTLTSPPEQHDRKTEGPKVTDGTAVIYRPPDTPTVTLTCHQHTWWVAQWNDTCTTDKVHTFIPEAKPATPLALGDRINHSTHHTNHPRVHWLALKTAMHWIVDDPATDTTLPETSLTLTRNLAAHVRRHGTALAQRWMSWPTDTERTLKAACKNTQISSGVRTGRRRDRDRHTAYSARTHRDRPPNRRQKSPDPNRGPAQGGRTPRPAGPSGPNRSPKWPQRRRHPIHNRSRRPWRAHFSRRRNVPPRTLNGQTAQNYRVCTEPRLEDN